MSDGEGLNLSRSGIGGYGRGSLSLELLQSHSGFYGPIRAMQDALMPGITRNDLRFLGLANTAAEAIAPLANKEGRSLHESFLLTHYSIAFLGLMAKANAPADNPLVRQLEGVVAESFAERFCD